MDNLCNVLSAQKGRCTFGHFAVLTDVTQRAMMMSQSKRATNKKMKEKGMKKIKDNDKTSRNIKSAYENGKYIVEWKSVYQPFYSVNAG